MIEIPEAVTLAEQIKKTIRGKEIVHVTAAYTPHKFAWYYGEPDKYKERLKGRAVTDAKAYGGMVEMKADDAIILLSDGIAFRYHNKEDKHPKKHQLMIEFSDGSAVSASVQMYGGMWCYNEGDKFEYDYYRGSKEKPSPLSNEFNEVYFDKLISSENVQKLSVKGVLATDQRIPGFGNGVLQDILWRGKIHPKCKVSTLSDNHKEVLYKSIKEVLLEMTKLGGRDTEKDLYGNNGLYKTKMSKNTLGDPCSLCGGNIKKEAYLGGSIYYCESCQET